MPKGTVSLPYFRGAWGCRDQRRISRCGVAQATTDKERFPNRYRRTLARPPLRPPIERARGVGIRAGLAGRRQKRWDAASLEAVPAPSPVHTLDPLREHTAKPLWEGDSRYGGVTARGTTCSTSADRVRNRVGQSTAPVHRCSAGRLTSSVRCKVLEAPALPTPVFSLCNLACAYPPRISRALRSSPRGQSLIMSGRSRNRTWSARTVSPSARRLSSIATAGSGVDAPWTILLRRA